MKPILPVLVLFIALSGCFPMEPGDGTWFQGENLDSRPVVTYPGAKPVTAPDRPAKPLLILPRVSSFEEFLALPEEEMDPALGALLFASEEYAGLPVEPFLRYVDDLARLVREKSEGRTGPDTVDVLNHVLYFDQGFRYDPEDPNGILPENLYLNKVLQRKKGYCVSLAALYLAIGKRLRLPLFGVRVPTHFIVRYDDGTTTRNIETTDYGIAHDDSYYAKKYRIAEQSVRDGIYLVNISTRQIFADLFNNRGTLHGVRGDWRGALRALERGIEIDDRSTFLFYNRAVILARLGREDDAMRDFEHTLSLDPNNVFAMNNVAEIHANAGRHDQALLVVNRALSIHPEYSNGYLNRGVIFHKMGKADLALENIEKALRYDGQNAMAYVYRARMNREKGRYNHAVYDLNRAVTADPQESQAWAERGFTYLAMDRADKALGDFDEAVRLAPEAAAYRVNRGVVLLKTGDIKGARADFDEAVRLAPEQADPLLKRAALSIHERRFDEALADLDRAVAIERSNPAVLLKRGVALRALGRRAEAEADLVRAAHLAPAMAEVQKYLGLLYRDLGEADKARTHLRKFLDFEKQDDRERARVEAILKELEK